MRVLITRPQEKSLLLAQRLQATGHEVLIDSLIHVTPIDPSKLRLPSFSDIGAVLTTSYYAIECLSRLTDERAFSLWCVGTESEKIAKNLGFENTHAASGSAQDLLNQFLKMPFSHHQKPVFHLSGDVIRFDIAAELQKKGIPASRLIVYETQEAQYFSPSTHQALKTQKLDVVLFYSLRTANIFKKLCYKEHLVHYCQTLTALCLSDTIKLEIQDIPWKNIQIAKKTTTDDLLFPLIMSD